MKWSTCLTRKALALQEHRESVNHDSKLYRELSGHIDRIHRNARSLRGIGN